MSSAEANRIADSKNLDLVKIDPHGNPPVCKIMDYGKFKFESVKREKELKKSNKNSELREMTLSMNIDKHDLETKARKTVEMLEAGDKVKVSLRMRGREQAHAKLGVEKLRQFFGLCDTVCVIDLEPKTEGRNIIMILVPIKKPSAQNKTQGNQQTGGNNKPKQTDNAEKVQGGDKEAKPKASKDSDTSKGDNQQKGEHANKDSNVAKVAKSDKQVDAKVANAKPSVKQDTVAKTKQKQNDQ